MQWLQKLLIIFRLRDWFCNWWVLKTSPSPPGPHSAYSPLREHIWQSEDGDFSKLLSC